MVPDLNQLILHLRNRIYTHETFIKNPKQFMIVYKVSSSDHSSYKNMEEKEFGGNEAFTMHIKYRE